MLTSSKSRPVRSRRTGDTPRHALRGGFTLVEMLVAIGLVVLMMSMFAEIFQLASGAMTKQRGIGENDQRARSMNTMLRDDLDHRTFRFLLPFRPVEPTWDTRARIEKRQGYFYISENDPADDSDDVLQFTIRATNTQRAPNEIPYVGRARVVPDNASGTPQPPNQPEFDDGYPNPNGMAHSTSAEVAYFLRNGTLYRRLLLLRRPLHPRDADQQPNYNGSNLFLGPSNLGNAQYLWQNFDFSAHYQPGAQPGPMFHNESHLSNAMIPGRSNVISLGIPLYRFGFRSPTGGPPTAGTGMPREFSGTNGTGDFLGRFTHQETSSTSFDYPQLSMPGALDPSASMAWTYTNGAIQNYTVGSTRQGEDILLTNVLSFDVKIWDDGASQFVDIGGPSAVTYSMGARTNPGFGPAVTSTGNNRVFDTWHPTVDINYDGVMESPPFDLGPLTNNGPDGQPGVSGVDDDGNGTMDDATESGWPGSDDVVFNLKAVQITVRYRDPSSNQIRQVTIVHSLTE